MLSSTLELFHGTSTRHGIEAGDERECLVDSLERELEALPTIPAWRAEDWLGDSELVREGETVAEAAERLLGEADEEGVYIIDSIEAVIEARMGEVGLEEEVAHGGIP